MTEAITLYYAPDNASLIVRMVLEELGLPFETQLVDRRVSEQRSEPYLKLNPRGLIPVCVIDGEPVFETAAIALALAERYQHGEQAMVPKAESAERSAFLKWLFFISNTLHADLRSMFYPQHYIGDTDPEGFRGYSLARINQSFSILNDAYGRVDHVYLFSDEPSVVDVYLATCMRWAQIYPVALRGQIRCSSYSELHQMMGWLQQRTAIRDACQAEGITGDFFTAPDYATPPEGSAM